MPRLAVFFASIAGRDNSTSLRFNFPIESDTWPYYKPNLKKKKPIETLSCLFAYKNLIDKYFFFIYSFTIVTLDGFS